MTKLFQLWTTPPVERFVELNPEKLWVLKSELAKPLEV